MVRRYIIFQVVFFLFICTLFQKPSEADQIIFDNPRTVIPINYCTSVALGDLDNDEDLDVAAVINMYGDYVAFNDGNANFTWKYIGLAGIKRHRDHVALADIDLDGDLDFINTYIWYLNDGSGNFSYGGSFDYAVYRDAVVAGDLNGDNFPDIVRPAHIYLNSMAGGFIRGQNISGSSECAVALGDVENDGDFDIAVDGVLWLNDGAGNFILSNQNLNLGPPPAYRTWGREFADFNNDGYLDIIMCSTNLGGYVMINNGFGNFNWNGKRLSGSFNAATADLNLDGNCDLVLTGIQGGSRIYLGNGGGLFGDSVQYLPTTGPHGGSCDLALGDLNGDNLIDIVYGPKPTAYLNVLPKIIEVDIDIKPGSYPNSINIKSKGKIPVAILTTDDFDASKVDGSTVRFGPNEAEPFHYAFEDVDWDGDLDMTLHFKTQDTGIECGDVEATLIGKTFDDKQIKGIDSIKTVGCKK